MAGASLAAALLVAPLAGVTEAAGKTQGAQPGATTYCDGAGASTYDTCYGANDLYNENGGYNNTAFGFEALTYDTTGHENVAVGSEALLANSSGYYDTAVGTNTLVNTSSGYQDTAIGDSAMYSNTTGSNDTALGFEAGQSANGANANTTGSNNTFLGYNTGPGTATQLTNATAIGAGATVGESNALVLGAPGTSVGVGTATPDQALTVAGKVHIAGLGNGIVFPDGSIQTTAASGTGLPSAQNGQYLRYGNGSWQASAILASDLPSGSASYIQNTSSQQANTSFNVSGNGTLGGALTAGSAAIGTAGTPNSLLQVGTAGTSFGSYVQLPEVTSTASSPPASDCNSSSFVGRMVLQYNSSVGTISMWGCTSAGKWKVIK